LKREKEKEEEAVVVCQEYKVTCATQEQGRLSRKEESKTWKRQVQEPSLIVRHCTDVRVLSET
jgi:hypothetical protein